MGDRVRVQFSERFLEVCSRRGAIQIHVYLYLYLYLYTLSDYNDDDDDDDNDSVAKNCNFIRVSPSWMVSPPSIPPSDATDYSSSANNRNIQQQ